VHWNDPAILRAAGTRPTCILDLLERYAQGTPTPGAVAQWFSRDHIPDMWRARIVYCLLTENRVRAADLFRLGDPKRRTPRRAPRKAPAAPAWQPELAL
jgi:hypothetical protein